MSWKNVIASLLFVLLASSLGLAEKPKTVLLLGQKRDHPEKSHEYMAGLRVLKKSLKGVDGLKLRIHKADEPWPEGPKLLEDADGVVLFLGQGARWEQADPRRLKALKELAARGGAIVGLHWAIGTKDAKYIAGHLELMGGCHGGPDRKYTFVETDVKVVDPRHPITFGVQHFRLEDEYYYQLKFAKKGTVKPILQALIEGKPETVAWAFQRPDGGRSFGFSGMHYHRNWGIPACRRLVAQGLLWALKMPVPEKGLAVEVSEKDLKLK
ncbi:MAG: ThuA domain-containing protein [Planctomycetota bacterium]|jgi:type 1 glutamine amidotransferase